MAADLEGARLGKAFGNILAGRTLIAVEVEIVSVDIDLMDELVIVGEGQRFTLVDGDLGGAEGPALLNDGMRVVREGGNGHDDEQGDQYLPHFDTT